MSTSLLRRSLLLAAVLAAAPSAIADVSLPPGAAPAASRPTSMRTHWPAALSGARSCVASAWTPATDDVVRWSNARGAALTIDRPTDHNWPLPAALVRDPPRSLTWVRHGRPGISYGYMGEPMPHDPHGLDLFLSCGDDAVRWECDDRQPSCRTSFAVSVGRSEPEAKHHADWDRVKAIIAAGAGARDLLVADALRLAQDACAGERCADVVALALQQLRAAAAQPPWQVTRSEPYQLELTAPGASDQRLRCDGPRYECTLTLGRTVSFTVHGHWDTTPFEALAGPTWTLQSPSGRGSGYAIKDEAIR